MGTVAVPTARSSLSALATAQRPRGARAPLRGRKGRRLVGRSRRCWRGGERCAQARGREQNEAGRARGLPGSAAAACQPGEGLRGGPEEHSDSGRGSDGRSAAGPQALPPSAPHPAASHHRSAGPRWATGRGAPGSSHTAERESVRVVREGVVCSEEGRDAGGTGPKGCVPACLPRPAASASQTAARAVPSQEMTAGPGSKPQPGRRSAPCQARGLRWRDKARAGPLWPRGLR